jgi:hypothetical protein
MKANLPAIILAAGIVIAAIIYACSTRYEIVIEHVGSELTMEYSFDRWSADLKRIHAQ